MSIALQIDTRELRQALRQYADATKKDAVDIINRAAWGILVDRNYGVIKTTPVADKAQIEADLINDKIALKIVSKRIAKTEGKVGARGNLLKNQEWRNRVGKAAKALIGRRKGATTYVKSGWVKAAAEMKSKTPRATEVLKGRSPVVTKRFAGADNGEASVATERSLVAEIVNSAKDILDVKGASSALQKAVNAQARDMVAYAEKKMTETAKKHSAR